MKEPYAWAASIADTQIVMVGGVAMVTLPGEFTTMSGRRVREAMYSAAEDSGVADQVATIMLTGLSNVYTGYITTEEEYQQQERKMTIHFCFTRQLFTLLFSLH
jgi:neutral ceramidase